MSKIFLQKIYQNLFRQIEVAVTESNGQNEFPILRRCYETNTRVQSLAGREKN